MMRPGAELRFLLVLGIVMLGGVFACGLVWFVSTSDYPAKASAFAYLRTWWLFVVAYVAYAVAILISWPFVTKAAGNRPAKRMRPTDPGKPGP